MNLHTPQRLRGLLLGLVASTALVACAPNLTREPEPVAAPPPGPHNIPYYIGSETAPRPARAAAGPGQLSPYSRLCWAMPPIVPPSSACYLWLSGRGAPHHQSQEDDLGQQLAAPQ